MRLQLVVPSRARRVAARPGGSPIGIRGRVAVTQAEATRISPCARQVARRCARWRRERRVRTSRAPRRTGRRRRRRGGGGGARRRGRADPRLRARALFFGGHLDAPGRRRRARGDRATSPGRRDAPRPQLATRPRPAARSRRGRRAAAAAARETSAEGARWRLRSRGASGERRSGRRARRARRGEGPPARRWRACRVLRVEPPPPSTDTAGGAPASLARAAERRIGDERAVGSAGARRASTPSHRCEQVVRRARASRGR